MEMWCHFHTLSSTEDPKGGNTFMDSYIFGAPKDKDAHSSKDRTKMSSARNEVIHISLDDVEFDAFDVYNNNEGDTNIAR